MASLVSAVSKGAPAGGGTGNTAAINTGGATLIVIVLNNIGSIGTVADSQGNTWTARNTIEATSGRYVTVFDCIAPSTSGSHTFSGGNSFAGISVAAFNSSTYTFDDDSTGNINLSGNTVSAGSITPASANNLWVASLGGDFTSPTINSGFSIATSVDTVPSTSEGTAIGYLIQTAATAQNPQWTVATNGFTINSAGYVYSYTAGGGGGLVVNPLSGKGGAAAQPLYQ